MPAPLNALTGRSHLGETTDPEQVPCRSSPLDRRPGTRGQGSQRLRRPQAALGRSSSLTVAALKRLLTPFPRRDLGGCPFARAGEDELDGAAAFRDGCPQGRLVRVEIDSR